uniref:Prohibitin n=1 Tax=Parascaris univalens TaxID=6257 RepID=A0A915AJT8_PARUN
MKFIIWLYLALTIVVNKSALNHFNNLHIGKSSASVTYHEFFMVLKTSFIYVWDLDLSTSLFCSH